MSFSSRVIRLSILSLLVGGMLGCSSFAKFGFASAQRGNFPQTQISQIPEKPSNDSKVYLKGKVIHQAPFVGSGAYQLEDETGKVWVITNQTLPPKGKEIAIEAEINYQSIPIGTEEMGEIYVLEIKQIQPQRIALQPVKPVNQAPVETQPVVTINPPVTTVTPTIPASVEPPISLPAAQKPKPALEIPFLPHKQLQK